MAMYYEYTTLYRDDSRDKGIARRLNSCVAKTSTCEKEKKKRIRRKSQKKLNPG